MTVVLQQRILDMPMVGMPIVDSLAQYVTVNADSVVDAVVPKKIVHENLV